MKDLDGLLVRLFPIHRSITGNGVRETLKIIQKTIPLTIHEIPSGTQVFDWTVPDEWNIKDAWVKDSSGNKVIDFQKCNLHIISYSEPFKGKVSLEELKRHLQYLVEYPDWIPYVTSYYNRMWGFCISHNTFLSLKDDTYEVMIDSEFKKGSMTYGELIIPGETDKEVLFATNICHPSLANNELSGPVMATYLADHVLKLPKRRYTYRFVFTPETIGSIAYLSQHKDEMIKNTIAGYMLTCVGGPDQFTYMSSRNGNTLTDRLTTHILNYTETGSTFVDYCMRGSDERQYCWPGIDLPVGSLMRSKYAEYNAYHTSADNLNFVSNENLNKSFDKFKLCIEMLEANKKYLVKTMCEPQLGRRGLYPTLSVKNSIDYVRDMRNVLVYCDGQNDLLDIAEKIKRPIVYVKEMTDKFLEADIIKEVE